MKHEQLTEKIIGCAYQVYSRMGFGFLESVYENCLMIELKKAGLQAEAQKRISICYEHQNVGDFIADIIVENEVILELKSVHQIVKAHEVQLVNYLTATKKDVGLIINFGEQKVEIKRKVRELNPAHQQDHNPVHPVHPV
jgi:GxxExxY protein